jgi:hypothetical protein
MLQSQVYTSAAGGVPGAKADMNAFDYFPLSLAAEADISVGTFVWPGSDPEKQAKYGGTGSPLGFVERSLVHPLYDVVGEGDLVIPEGETLSIATSGCFWARTSSAAAVGQAVFASTTDGTVSAAASGSTVNGSVETGWIVISGGAAGDVIMIKGNRTTITIVEVDA